MRKYLFNEIYKAAKTQNARAQTIAEVNAAIVNMRGLIPHIVEQGSAQLDEAREALNQLEQKHSALSAAADVAEAKRKMDVKMAKQRDPKTWLRKHYPGQVSPMALARPQLFKECNIVQFGPRYEVRTLKGSMLLVSQISKARLADLKAFMRGHYDPITWTGDLPTNRPKKESADDLL